MFIDFLVRRYRDCYRVAGRLVGTGSALKIAAWVVGLLFAGFAILAAQSHTNEPFGAMQNAAAGITTLVSVAIAVGSWIFLYTWGVLLSAAGQMLLAALDTAVHTSPFLPPDARIAAMGLPPPPAPPKPQAPTYA